MPDECVWHSKYFLLKTLNKNQISQPNFYDFESNQVRYIYRNTFHTKTPLHSIDVMWLKQRNSFLQSGLSIWLRIQMMFLSWWWQELEIKFTHGCTVIVRSNITPRFRFCLDAVEQIQITQLYRIVISETHYSMFASTSRSRSFMIIT